MKRRHLPNRLNKALQQWAYRQENFIVIQQAASIGYWV